jgi:HEPN domain-containing protein
MTASNQAILFVQKADEDLHVLGRLLGDRSTTDAIWGFHAQQATEKLLKSLLTHFGIRFPFTHRLLQLADLLSDHNHPLDSQYDSLIDLTPFAVEYRYSTLPGGPNDPPLDRQALFDLLRELRKMVGVEVKAP